MCAMTAFLLGACATHGECGMLILPINTRNARPGRAFVPWPSSSMFVKISQSSSNRTDGRRHCERATDAPRDSDQFGPDSGYRQPRPAHLFLARCTGQCELL